MTGLASALTFGGVLLLTAPSSGHGPSVAPRAEPAAPARPPLVYYPRCAAARAAGAAPIDRGQPGYRPALDADGDGIACEPYDGE